MKSRPKPDYDQMLADQQYKQVEKALRRDYSVIRNDRKFENERDDYAVALIGIGRFQEAIDHIQNTILPNRPHTFDFHEVHLGIASWYLGQHKAAIEFWRKALKSGYATDRAFSQTLAMLMFANTHKPKLITKSEILELWQKIRSRLIDPCSYEEKLILYYHGEMDIVRLMGYANLLSIGFAPKRKLHDCWNDDRRRLYFHLALERLAAKNLNDYYNYMSICVNMKSGRYRSEILVASLECQRVEKLIQVDQDSCGYFRNCESPLREFGSLEPIKKPKERARKLKKS